jgi:single-strand DNA-binding protein
MVAKNKVQLVGNLGSNPEVKTLEGGRKLAKFSLATNETYQNSQGEKVKETQWHNLVAWGRLAEVAEKQLQKGAEVMIEGKLVHHSYSDKEGVKRYSTEVEVSDVLRIESRKDRVSE